MAVKSSVLTVDQAASRLRLNPETIRRAIRKGELPATRNTLQVGGPMYVSVDDLDAWAGRRTGQPAAGGAQPVA